MVNTVKKVLIPIADGTEEIEAVCLIDTLRRAGLGVTVASVDRLQVTASRSVKLVADALIADCVNQTYDCIALPGGMPGAEHLRDSADLIGMLKKQKAEATRIADFQSRLVLYKSKTPYTDKEN